MRRLSAAVLILCVPACTGGASPPNGGGGSATSSSNPTAPSDESDDGARAGSSGDGSAGNGGVCADYIACVAKKAPEMLDTVTDAYGKNGSCWSEMSTEACDAACTKGMDRADCDECDPTTGSCLGQSCYSRGRCATGELCAKDLCIEDAFARSCEDTPCPSPYVCKDTGEGQVCLLECSVDADCPDGTLCANDPGICLP